MPEAVTITPPPASASAPPSIPGFAPSSLRGWAVLQRAVNFTLPQALAKAAEFDAQALATLGRRG